MLNETDTSARRFFLQAIDADSNCPVYEVGFTASDVGMLISLIGEGSSDIKCAYDLPLATALKIVNQYDVSFDPSGHPVRLRPSSAHDNLPYRVHTGRELLLMLQGVKPLAVFSHPVEQVLTEERFFEPHVAIGRFVKREYSTPMVLRRRGDSKDLIYRHVLYALAHEAWRIDAYILLQDVMIQEGWSAGLERLEGELLGYTKRQNDIFVEYMERAQEERMQWKER